MANTNTKFHNSNRYEIEGTFDLSAAAAVLPITAGLASKTVRGEGMTCAKNGVGTYDVTVKLAGVLDGLPFRPVELLYGNANIVATAVATVLDCRIASVTVTASNDILIKVITAQTTGAAADTTGAITVAFRVVFSINRMDPVL